MSGKDDLAFEGTDITEDRVIGFVHITNKGKAQQVTVNIKLLSKATKFLESLANMGFEKVTVTVQDNKPLILGGKQIGLGIAPTMEEEET